MVTARCHVYHHIVTFIDILNKIIFVSEDMLKNRRQYFNMQICTTELKILSPFNG